MKTIQGVVELLPDGLQAEMEKIRKIAVDKTRKVSYTGHWVCLGFWG